MGVEAVLQIDDARMIQHSSDLQLTILTRSAKQIKTFKMKARLGPHFESLVLKHFLDGYYFASFGAHGLIHDAKRAVANEAFGSVAEVGGRAGSACSSRCLLLGGRGGETVVLLFFGRIICHTCRKEIPIKLKAVITATCE